MERIPILKMGVYLLVTIQVDMHDRLAMTLQDDLTARIVQHRTKAVLIDISALEMVDSFIGRMIGNIAAMSRVLDAETVVVGMRPAVAITLVELGLPLRRSHRAQRRARDGICSERSSTPTIAMATLRAEDHLIRSSEDVVVVRQAVRARAVENGFAWSSRPSS